MFTGGREAKQVPPPPLPLIIAESRNGRPWRRRINGFDGTEAEGDDVPGWVAECVLFSRLPTQREMKCAFVLQPAEGSSLPSMLQTRLNAPRILRVGKVASYALTKLAEQDIPMIVQPPVWDMAPGWVASAQPQQPVRPPSRTPSRPSACCHSLVPSWPSPPPPC